MLEACINGETNVVQQLLESPTSEEVGLNIKDHLGFTPLIWACYNGYKDIVKLLLDHSERIELNARNDCEETAFMNACKNGHKNVVKLLLELSERIELNASDNVKDVLQYLFS